MSKGSKNFAQLTSVEAVTWRMLSRRRYKVPELIAITGMTRKKVEYWDRIGLLKPSIRDHNAVGSQPASFYSAKEVIKALILCDLRQRGFTPSQLKTLAQCLEKQGQRLGDSELYLLSDGYSIYYAETGDRVVDLLKHKGQMLLVPVHEQIEKLRRRA
jgi:DNA-binding transcriptional MerR regulator